MQWRKMAPPSADWGHGKLALFKKNSELHHELELLHWRKVGFDQVGAMQRAGVRILAGTDVGNGRLISGAACADYYTYS
jgi:hypothetical protein